MKVNALYSVLKDINVLIDSGKYDKESIADMRKRMEDRTVFAWLRERPEIDTSALAGGVYGDFEVWYSDGLERMCSGYAGDELRKWGLKNRGLCVLLAWTLALIEMGEGVEHLKDETAPRRGRRGGTADGTGGSMTD